MLRFAYRLGAHFGILNPVSDILFRLTRRELVYWMAFFGLEPLEPDRADRRAAVHTAALADRIARPDEPTNPNSLVIDWAKLSEPRFAPPPTTEQTRVQEADSLILAINTAFRR